MTLIYHEPCCETHQGHVLDVLAEMPPESVDCCITSPPYWSLRKYSGDQNLIWGGKEDCHHEWQDNSYVRNNDQTAGPIQRGNKGSVGRDDPINNAFCSLCGAWRGALGLEPIPALYLSHLVQVFRAVRRVLRPWGTCFINLGDSYAGSGSPGGDFRDGKGGDNYCRPYNRQGVHLKPLDLCGIPESLVLALRADGWYWRSTIIWAKTNPMPESVAGWSWQRHKIKVGKVSPETYTSQKNRVGEGKGTGWSPAHPELGQAPTLADWRDCPGCPVCQPNDGLVLRKGSWRPTSSFEYVFMLAKSKDYFCDGEAVREPNHPDNRTMTKAPLGIGTYAPQGLDGHERWPNSNGRNLRDVWTINTQSFSRAHFATFPEDLVTKPILASTSDKGNCPKCGMPWVRILQPSPEYQRLLGKGWRESRPRDTDLTEGKSRMPDKVTSTFADYQTLSWRPSCTCGLAEAIPAIVLDPFCGSGTTLAIAKRLGRHAIGIDLSPEYCQMAKRRVEAETAPFREQP